jgi:hypothetical protein
LDVFCKSLRAVESSCVVQDASSIPIDLPTHNSIAEGIASLALSTSDVVSSFAVGGEKHRKLMKILEDFQYNARLTYGLRDTGSGAWQRNGGKSTWCYNCSLPTRRDCRGVVCVLKLNEENIVEAGNETMKLYSLPASTKVGKFPHLVCKDIGPHDKVKRRLTDSRLAYESRLLPTLGSIVPAGEAVGNTGAGSGFAAEGTIEGQKVEEPGVPAPVRKKNKCSCCHVIVSAQHKENCEHSLKACAKCWRNRIEAILSKSGLEENDEEAALVVQMSFNLLQPGNRLPSLKAVRKQFFALLRYLKANISGEDDQFNVF